MEKINIVLAIHDKTGQYTQHAVVTMISVIENTKSSIVFHILKDKYMNKKNVEQLIGLEEKYCNVSVELYDVEIDIKMELRNIKQFSIGTLYRLYMVDVLPIYVNKVIYLDSDIICNLDIISLWQQEMNGKSLAAVADQKVGEKDAFYFNAGVLLLNLKKIRDKYNFYVDNMNFLRRNPNAEFLDQDSLNYLFKHDVYRLEEKYNMPARYLMKKVNDFNNEESWKGCIWHFNNPREKPWDVKKNKIDKLYWYYYSLSNYGNTFEKFYDSYSLVNPSVEDMLKNGIVVSKRDFFRFMIDRFIREVEKCFRRICK